MFDARFGHVVPIGADSMALPVGRSAPPRRVRGRVEVIQQGLRIWEGDANCQQRLVVTILAQIVSYGTAGS